MKNPSLFLILPFLLTLSCNKNNSSPAASTPAAPSTSTSTVQPVNGGMASGAGNNTNNLHGVLQAQRVSLPALGGYSAYECRAAFKSTGYPLGYYYMMGGIFATFGQNAGVLKLNGTTLKYDATTQFQQNRYMDTVSTRSYTSGASWDLGGNISFGAFTATVSRGFPVISNINYLPAALSKTVGCTVNFGASNYSNTDSLIVYINGSSGGMTPFKHLAGNASSVTFSTAELSGLTTGSGMIIVNGINYSNKTISGKNYVFVLQHDLSNPIQIDP